MPKSQFECMNCGEHHARWTGQCSNCGEWNQINERPARKEAPKAVARQGYAGTSKEELIPLAKAGSQTVERLDTGLSEYNRVLGGGLVRGGSLLIGGNPGAGKSTLLLQTGCRLSMGNKVIYCAGEETVSQIRDRGDRLRLDMDKLLAIEITNVLEIAHLMEREKPDVIIVDSIQTCYHPEVESEPGNPAQLKTCAAFLNRKAKSLGISLLLVGHFNKRDELAGPMTIMHIVDALLLLSVNEESRFRLLRAEKNRYGSTTEVGIFEMTAQGLREIENPSAIFLNRDLERAPGSVVSALWQGTRALFVEVQGLLDESPLANPRRVSVGVDGNRLSMLLAVINKHGGVRLFNQDVYVNVVGGLRVTETAIDLSIVVSVLSSLTDQTMPADLVTFGEVGLTGEIRPCMNSEERLRQAAKLGFTQAVVASANVPKTEIDGLRVIGIPSIGELCNYIENQYSQAAQ